MSGYTQGPWEVSEDKEDMSFIRLTVGPKYTTVCTVIGTKTPMAEYYAGAAYVYANARLIAAAPDLYEACKLHIDTLSKQARNGEPLDRESLIRAQIMMAKALEKAEAKS